MKMRPLQKKRKNKSNVELNDPNHMAIPIVGTQREELSNSADFDLPVCVM
jgi:hypothetical protein